MRAYPGIPAGLALLVAAWAGAALRVHATPQAPTAGRIWVGRTADIETALKSASVVRLEDIGTGVTHPRRAYVAPGGSIESFTARSARR